MSKTLLHPTFDRVLAAKHLMESRLSQGLVSDPNPALLARVRMLTEMVEAGWKLVTSSSWASGDVLYFNDTFQWGSDEVPEWLAD